MTLKDLRAYATYHEAKAIACAAAAAAAPSLDISMRLNNDVYFHRDAAEKLAAFADELEQACRTLQAEQPAAAVVLFAQPQTPNSKP